MGFSVKCLVIAPWILGATLMLLASQHDKDLASRQAATVGQIVAHEPSNHNRYGYKFRVDGHEYRGWETPLKAEPQIGQSVTIYYDTRSPDENALSLITPNWAVPGSRERLASFSSVRSSRLSFTWSNASRIPTTRNSSCDGCLSRIG
jgi:hypothetical protein